jgi:ribA/ribD-fused uncharacterized protein
MNPILCDKCELKAKYRYGENNEIHHCGRHCLKPYRDDPRYLIDNSSAMTITTQRIIQPKDDKVRFRNILGNEFQPFTSFYPAPFEWKGIRWRTSEHAFQAMKFYYQSGFRQRDVDLLNHVHNIINTREASQARSLGEAKQPQIREDWNASGQDIYPIKSRAMYEIMYQKFYQNPNIKKLLLSTEEREIIDMDDQQDNMNGHICMMLRKAFKENQN